MKTALWTRESVKRHLAQRFYTRFHMSLILSSSALCAMLTNWLLLHGGVGAMWLRYPLAIAVAYGAFLGGVGLWLRYVGLWLRYVGLDGGTGRRSEREDFSDGFSTGGGNGGSSSGSSFELPAPRGGGGQFGGGGASSSWAEGEALPAASFSKNGVGVIFWVGNRFLLSHPPVHAP